MRLGTCIALELVCAMGAAAGVLFVAGRGVETARDALGGSHEASAANAPSSRGVERLPGAQLHVPAPPRDPTVYELDDDTLLEPLAATPVTKLKLNHGGTSLSLRLDFASGARAAFKPEQTHPQSDPRREIAAFRIDRLLGIGHVPPAKPAAFPLADLIAAAEPGVRDYTAQRFADEAIAHDGMVRGEVSWWIPEIRDAMIGGFRIDESEGVAQWSQYLQAGAIVPPEMKPYVAQIATVIVFDVLIDNADRWTGNNTKCSPDRQTLYFMDNTLAFSIFTLGHETNLNPLHRIQVFPKELVKRLRALTFAQLTKAIDVGADPLGPLLQPAEVRAILARRDHLIEYVDALVAELGEKAVLALP